MKSSIIILFIALIMATGTRSEATTWGDEDLQCPICKTKGSFKVPASYGSYIYQSLTKYQMIFWPKTDKNSIYICKNCGFSCFMDNFVVSDSINTQKIKEMLALEKPELKFSNYNDYPVLKRLDLAEKCYKLMDMDDYFWCEFYRVKAYYSGLDNDSTEVRRNRIKALGLAEKMAKDKKYAPILKELIYIIASMYYYTGNYKEASENAKACKLFIYEGFNMDKKNANALNEYLMQLNEELLAMIQLKMK